MAGVSKHSRPSTMGWGQRALLALLSLVVVVAGVGAWRLLGDRGGTDEVLPLVAGAGGEGATATAADDGTTGNDEAGDGAADEDEDGEDGDGTAAPTQEPVAAGDATCGFVTVWAAPALLPAVDAAASRAGDDCLEYAVVARGSSAAQSELRVGTAPDVWVPDSLTWPALMAEEGVDLEVGPSVASSPVLLTGVPEVIDGLAELGIDEGSSWADLLTQYRDLAAAGPEAPVALRVGDPRADPASMALLASTSAQLGGWTSGEGPGRRLLVTLAQTAVQGDPLSAVRADPRSLVPATEQQIGAAVEQGAPLQGLALDGGSGVVRMPFVRLGDPGDLTDAVEALERELTGDQAAQDLAGLHLRAGEDGAAPGVDGVPDGVGTDEVEPDPQEALALARTWTVVAPQSRILALIDISGSMAADAGDGQTRIDLTRAATQTALSVIPQQTAIGLWYFATSLDGDTDHVEAVPMRALNQEVRSGVSQQEVLLAETEDLTVDSLTGDTGLNDSLWAAYQHMQAEGDASSISSVLLLTDGINDDSTDGLSDDEVVDLLAEARESGDRPVTMVLIGMGPDVDEEALDRLASAAGGESFVLRDPRELPQVFVDVVARRAAG